MQPSCDEYFANIKNARHKYTVRICINVNDTLYKNILSELDKIGLIIPSINMPSVRSNIAGSTGL